VKKFLPVRREVVPFVIVTAALFGLVAATVMSWVCLLSGAIVIGYFLYFFRDPERVPPGEEDVVVAGADGVVASIRHIQEDTYLNAFCIRISIFLSLFDVHVNRAPIAGNASFLGYFPGKRLFTFQEKSSEVNQHNKLLIAGKRTRCLVCQIVGPVCRRVVYWLPHDCTVPVAAGDRIGMMKFGSRLDVYLPARDVETVVKPGDRVRAGETVVARLKAHAAGDKADAWSLVGRTK